MKIKQASHLYYFFIDEKCTIIFQKANAICKYFDMWQYFHFVARSQFKTLGLNKSSYIIFTTKLCFFFKFFRFEEECKTIEEEQCQTVYDDAWENVCEMVNVTLPATNCREVTRIEMEKKYVYPKLYMCIMWRILICVVFIIWSGCYFTVFLVGAIHKWCHPLRGRGICQKHIE